MHPRGDTLTVPDVLDLTDRAFHEDPYPVYERLRETAPAVRTSYGSWVVARFAEVSALLRDPRLRADFPADPRWVERHGGAGSTTVSDGRHWMLLREGIDHDGIRRAFHDFFTPRAVACRTTAITQAVEQVLERLDPTGPVDIVSDVAEPIVVAAMSDTLGLSTGHAPYAAWTADISRMTDPVPGPRVRERVDRAMTEFRAHVETLTREDRLSGIAAALLYDNAAPTQSTSAVVANLVMLAMAGTDTTVSQITLAVRALLGHPDQLARVRADPDTAARTIAEFARYDGPVHLVTRRTAEPVAIGAAVVPAGAKVMLCIGSANRDPARYPDAHVLDLTRTGVAALPFGDGAHYCLGAHLGRLITATTLTALFRRHPSLTPAHPLERLAWRPSVVARRPERLPVLLS
ncbi:cytochrome P450 [Actinobacteria bacterium OK074]|nr:cytochrome P450 [Actinobacteria bacterium OK074]